MIAGVPDRKRQAMRRTYRRLAIYGGLALVTALVIGASQGTAGGIGTITVPVEHENECASTGFPQVGTARFSREGNTLSVNVTLRRATPNATYYLQLWNNENGVCDFITDGMGKFKTDSNGNGAGHLQANVAGYRVFFVAAIRGMTKDFEDSLDVYLP